MEKSSEKIIRQTSPRHNPFNQMLSEVHLQLPSPLPKKKKEHNLVLQCDSFIDRASQKTLQIANTPRFVPIHPQPPRQYFEVLVHGPVKGAQASNRSVTTREQLISTWLVQHMSKRQLLGLHWQSLFSSKKRGLLAEAFATLKDHYPISANYTFQQPTQYLQTQKTQSLVRILSKCVANKMNEALHAIVALGKDSELFELHHYVKQSVSEILKIDSEFKPNYPKGTTTSREIPEHPSAVRKHSLKASEQAPSEDLSGLILNHAKLHIQLDPQTCHAPQERQQLPNREQSVHLVDSLGLQTRKAIATSRRLSGAELPLQSQKAIGVQPRALRVMDSIIESQMDQSSSLSRKKRESPPITISYLLRANCRKQEPERQDIVGRLACVQSFYQAARPVARNVFVPPKKTTSLDSKPCSARFVSPERNIAHQSPLKPKRPDEYYPGIDITQATRRHRSPFTDDKPRAHSATPRITFTFTTNQPQLPLPTPHPPKQTLINPPIHHDFILQNSLLHQESPSQQPSRLHERKINKLQDRSHIRDNLLPDSYDEYYHFGSRENTVSPKHHIKVPFLSTSNASTNHATIIREQPRDKLQTQQDHQHFTVTHQRPGQGGKESGKFWHACKVSQQGRASLERNQLGLYRPSKGRNKSPKDKILVTCSSRGKI